jgi:hypothetical protein
MKARQSHVSHPAGMSQACGHPQESDSWTFAIPTSGPGIQVTSFSGLPYSEKGCCFVPTNPHPHSTHGLALAAHPVPSWQASAVWADV